MFITKCKDKNPKIIKRVFKLFNKKLSILLCKSCLKNPEFSVFESEEKIQN